MLLDVQLKGLDGVKILKRIRRNQRLDAVPVIMLTVLDTLEDTVKGLGAGANDYVTKLVFVKVFSKLNLCLSSYH